MGLDALKTPPDTWVLKGEFIMRKASRLLQVLALCTASGILSPCAVIYDFSGTVNMFGFAQTFHYTSPSFISSDTLVVGAALDACDTGVAFPCFGIEFLPSGPDTPEHYPELLVETLNNDSSIGKVFYYFPLGSSFAIPGTLTTTPSIGNNGMLTISEFAVPEPLTFWGVLGGGIVGVAGGSLRRNTRLRGGPRRAAPRPA